jgi:hypothetical protein
MTLVTLQRGAPTAADAFTCRFCGARIVGTLQDDLLVGQPGTAAVHAVLCSGCGDALSALVEMFGSDLTVVVEGGRPINRPGPESELGHTRQRLSHEAETLDRTAQTLHAEAEKLSHLEPT